MAAKTTPSRVKPRVFLCYRRADTRWHAQALYQLLKRRFIVTWDIDTIKPGQDFRRVIAEAVASCDAFVALIGPEWLTAGDDLSGRRLDDPSDWVRLEIKAALDAFRSGT